MNSNIFKHFQILVKGLSVCVAGIGRMIKQISVYFAYFSLLDSCYHGHIVKKASLMRVVVRPPYLVQLESSDDRD